MSVGMSIGKGVLLSKYLSDDVGNTFKQVSYVLQFYLNDLPFRLLANSLSFRIDIACAYGIWHIQNTKDVCGI